MTELPPTCDADEEPKEKRMSTNEIRAEISSLNRSIDWNNCDIENSSQLQWYRRLAAELASRDTTRIPPCRYCKVNRWHISWDHSLECRLCRRRPKPAYRSIINYVYDQLSPRDFRLTISTLPPEQYGDKCRWCGGGLGDNPVTFEISGVEWDPRVCNACVDGYSTDTIRRTLTAALQPDDTTEGSE